MFSILFNLAEYIQHSDKEKFVFVYSDVLYAFGIIFSLALIAPTIMIVLLWLFSYKTEFNQKIGFYSMYGYSNIFLILSLVTPFFPKIVSIGVFGFSVFLATVFVYKECREILDKINEQGKKWISLFIAAVEIVSFLAYTLAFYVFN